MVTYNCLLLLKKKLFYENDLYSVILTTKILKNIKSSPVMLIWFHKISCYHLNKRVLWKSYHIYTDYLTSQKYKKCSPEKYALLLYLAVSIRWISIRWIFIRWISIRWIFIMFDVVFSQTHCLLCKDSTCFSRNIQVLVLGKLISYMTKY